MAVFDARPRPLHPDPEPRDRPGRRVRRAARQGHRLRPRRGRRRRLHGDHDRPRGPQPRRVRRPLRHRLQLRGRAHPVGDLADLRGDRGPGRGRVGGGRPVRRLPEGPRLRLRGVGRRHGRPDGRSRAWAGTPTRRWRSTRTAPSVYLSEDADGPERTLLPVDARREASGSGRACSPGSPPDAGTLAAMQIIMDDGSVLPDVAYLTSAQLGRPSPCGGSRCPSATRGSRPCASSSPTAR